MIGPVADRYFERKFKSTEFIEGVRVTDHELGSRTHSGPAWCAMHDFDPTVGFDDESWRDFSYGRARLPPWEASGDGSHADQGLFM